MLVEIISIRSETIILFPDLFPINVCIIDF